MCLLKKELTLGKVLGRGGFCVVHEVLKISLENGGSAKQNKTSEEDEHFIHNIVQDREFMAGHFIRKGKDYRYAIKKMQDSSRKDSQTFINSVVDLAVEARFLSVIRHPNIIKMRAMDTGDRFHPEFFVVLDKLYDIMPVRIQKWKKQKKGGLSKMMFDRKGDKEQAFWVERLTVAYDIACALNYLHGLQ
jgi:serine/threonine protein kinase